MKLSTKGRYGLRAIADLAIHSDGKPVSVASIAQRQNFSGNYLAIMFSTLKRAGLIKSIKGVNGGYMLKKDADDIYVGEILRVLEGDLSIIDSDITEEDREKRNLKLLIETNVWDVVSNRINEIVNSMTLKDLIDHKSLL